MKIGIDLDGVVIDSETTFRTYEEMIEHYTNLVKEYGEKLTAKWVYQLCQKIYIVYILLGLSLGL